MHIIHHHHHHHHHHEGKVDAITPFNKLFRGGGGFWPLMKIKLMFRIVHRGRPANFDPSSRYSWCYYPNQHIVQRGWQILTPHEDIVDVVTTISIFFMGGWRIVIPHEDKVDVITPTNILFKGGGELWSLMRIVLVLLPFSNILFREGGEFWPLMKIKLMFHIVHRGSNADPSWRYSWCYYPNQQIVQKGWRILIPYGDIVDVITPIHILFIGGGTFWSFMKIKLMLLPQPTYYSQAVANFNVMMIMMWLCDGWDDYDDDDDHDHDDCKCGATSGLGGRNLIPYKKTFANKGDPEKIWTKAPLKWREASQTVWQICSRPLFKATTLSFNVASLSRVWCSN